MKFETTDNKYNGILINPYKLAPQDLDEKARQKQIEYHKPCNRDCENCLYIKQIEELKNGER